ncbi:acetate--CoA ligase family protein [Variovorax sp. V15]|uniref:acetate--CoA ligase family protein n=1 Tax=Variovorax sp. V15 TaxID=3065952 RepID=UPI0034E842C4
MIVQSGQQAESAAHELGGAAVLKMFSEEITHKRDVSGVAVDVAPDPIADRLDATASEVECHTSSRPVRFLVREMVSGETELILGMYAMPLVGHPCWAREA